MFNVAVYIVCGVLLYFIVRCILSGFAIILIRKIELVILILIVFLICVALPHGALDWSTVCDCGISCQTHFFEENPVSLDNNVSPFRKPLGDPWDGPFYPTPTPMIDSYGAGTLIMSRPKEPLVSFLN